MYPTYLSDIIIRNYKGIKELELSFPPRPGVTILLGDNGVGKTSILEAIATGLSGYLEGVRGSSPRNILIQDIRIHTETLGGASTAIQQVTPVEIICKASINGEEFTWERTRELATTGHGATTKTLDSTNGSLRGFATKLTNDPHEMLPVLSYFSTNRLSAAEKISNNDISKLMDKVEQKLHDRRSGYTGCLRNTIDKEMIKAWVLKMDMEHYFRDSEIPEYEAFKDIVSSTMMLMSDLANPPKLYYSRQFRDIVYEEGNQPLPISYLSAGYQSLLWIVMDIACRIALLNPHFGGDMRQTSGIVLIDELDMHLHPKWQWNVLRALSETFPKIQFIVATHSPILVSSCKDGNLISIDENHQVCSLSSAYGYSIDDIVELVQGSSSAPRRIKELLRQFETAINKGDLESASKIYSVMKLEYGKDNSQVKYAEEELRFENFDFSEE